MKLFVYRMTNNWLLAFKHTIPKDSFVINVITTIGIELKLTIIVSRLINIENQKLFSQIPLAMELVRLVGDL